MSIIFEALRKIETEKREGVPPPRNLPGGQPPPAGRRRLRSRLAASAAVFFAAAVLFRLLHLPPPPPAEPLHVPDAAAPVPMAEAAVEPRSILPAAAPLPLEPVEPAPAAAAPEAEAHLPALRLRGLSRSGSRSWAIINDRMLKVGDRIEDAEVVEILSDRVKLKRGDTLFTLVY